MFQVNIKLWSETFKLWILRNKANLATEINTMISMDCFFRVIYCSFNYVYKIWIFTLSPILGYSILPTPLQCYMAGLFNYTLGMGIVIFSLLTNVLRYHNT